MVQQGIIDALKKEIPTNIEEGRWTPMKKTVSTIPLAIAPKIKNDHYLKKTYPMSCWRNFKSCMLPNS